MRDFETTVDPDPGQATVRAGAEHTQYTTYDPTDSEAGVAIANALGEAIDRDPARIEPLATVVDPDALESLVGSGCPAGDRATTVTFEYQTYVVTVSSDGLIELDPRSR